MFWCKQRWLLITLWSIILVSSVFLLRHHYAHLVPQAEFLSLAIQSRGQPARQAQGQSPSGETGRQRYQETFATTTYKHLVQNAVWNPDQQEVTLALRDQIQQQESVIAGVSTNDAIYVVWRDLRNDEGDIYAQFIDARGNRLWPTDLRINTDSGLTLQFDPAIALDGAGNLWVAWIDSRNGNNDIYAQRISSAGQHLWSDDRQVNTDNNSADQGGVSIAALPDQRLALVWHDNRGGSYDIYTERLLENGALVWLENLRLNSDMTDSAQTYPAVAADSAGDTLVAWLDQRIGNSDLYAQRVAATGELLWSVEVQINQPAEAAQSHPRLAINQNGESWIGWVAAEGGHFLVQQIDVKGQLQRSSGLGVSQRYEPVDQNQQPFLTAAVDGTFVVAWVANADGNVYAQRFNSQGTLLWPEAVRLHHHTTDERIERNTVALTAARNAFIVAAWSDKRISDQGDIYSQAIDQTGARQWAHDRLINESSGKVDQQVAAVATFADGEYVVAWQDWRSGAAALYLQRLTPAGYSVWPVHVQATTVATASGQLAPDLAVMGDDTMLVWSDDRSGVARLYVQRFDKNGNREWSLDQPINHPADATVAQLNPAVTSDQQGRVFVVWEEISTAQRQLVLQQLGANGTPLWRQPVYVPTGDAPRLPDIKAGKDGVLSLAWIEKSADGANVFLQRATAEGTFIWPTRMQGNRAADEVNALNPPAVGVDDAGNPVVVWVDRREASIAAQRLNESGQPLWATDSILNSTPGGFAPLPDLAVLPNGNAIVAWQQLFEKRYTIAAQSLDGEGKPLWIGRLTDGKEVIVSTQTVGAQRPRLVADAQGNALIVWQERRFNNWDAVAQQLSPMGELAWPYDNAFVPEEQFYFAEGVIESTTINQTNQNISSALLSATYQHNGGNLQFWLSNNGGARWESVKPGTMHLFTTNGSDLRWKVLLQVNPYNFSRSPTIQEIWIDYDLVESGLGDPYEEDDLCTLARPLQPNGLAQTHTLAGSSPQDEDWVSVRLDQIAEIGFVAQTVNFTAPLQLALYTECGGQAIRTALSAEDGVATLMISSTANSQFFMQIRSTAGTNLPVNSYVLSAYHPEETRLAVIVAGAAANTQVATEINQVAARAYRTLHKHGYTAETIYFLSSNPTQDVDGDGQSDVDLFTSAAGVQSALEAWLPSVNQGPSTSLLLFLVGLGGAGQFQPTMDERLSIEQVNLWLANVERTNAIDQIAVMLEMNQAGRWIHPSASLSATGALSTVVTATISGKNRTILTATDDQGAAWHTPTGILFSDTVWTALDQGASLWESSTQAQTIVAQIGHRCASLDTPCQQPWLDDTGDARANQPDDGAFAQRWRLYPFAPSTAPVIQRVTIQPQGGQHAQTIDATLLRANNNTVVVAEILPPKSTVALPGDGSPPVAAFPVIRLQPVGAIGTNETQAHTVTYRATYDGFSELGVYKIIVYAQNEGDIAAMPVVLNVATGATLYLPLIANTLGKGTN